MGFSGMSSWFKRDSFPTNTRKMPYDIYADSMINCSHGFPLWKPGPPRLINGTVLDHVCVGHVGYIHEGRFKLLFDASEDVGCRQRGTDVPNDFRFNFRIAAEKRHALACLDERRSAGTEFWGFQKSAGVEADASVSPMAGVPNTPSASVQLSLHTTREQGAILKTNEETYVLNALCPNAFGEYIRQYYKSWVQFGQDNYHSVDYNNLVIVTGVDLTRSCDMLAYAKDSRELHVTFTVDASSLGSVSFGAWKDERHPGNLWPTSASDNAQTSSSCQTSAPTSMAIDSSSSLPRQCIYLRGWRSRFRKAPARIEGGAGPHDLGRLSPSPESDSSGSSEYGAQYEGSDTSMEPEVDIVAISEMPPFADPLQPLFDYILEDPEVELALVHDDQYQVLLNSAHGLQLDEQDITIQRALELIKPKIEIGKDSVGTLNTHIDRSAKSGSRAESEGAAMDGVVNSSIDDSRAPSSLKHKRSTEPEGEKAKFRSLHAPLPAGAVLPSRLPYEDGVYVLEAQNTSEPERSSHKMLPAVQSSLDQQHIIRDIGMDDSDTQIGEDQAEEADDGTFKSYKGVLVPANTMLMAGEPELFKEPSPSMTSLPSLPIPSRVLTTASASHSLRRSHRVYSHIGDSGSKSRAAGSSSGPRTTRQQYSACGACRMRRIKCNLKDVVVDLASGGRPACSNCQERGLNCIDEYDKTVKPGKQKLLRRGRRIRGAEAIFGKVNDVDALDQASSIPDLAPEFFQTAFFHRLQVQHPIIEPTEFIGRYQAYMNGNPHFLGADGLLVAKVFVLWAAAFGLDEAGKEIHDAESPLALTPPNDPLAAKRDGWGNRLTGMICELLRLIDVNSIMRKPTWDGVRVLLLFLPLLVQASDCEDAERQVMQETAYSHIYALCSRDSSKLTADGDQYTDARVRARAFWCAYVREGTTTGLRGGRLVITDDDLESFQCTLPIPQAHTPSISPAQAAFQQARHFAQITIEISGACRLIHAALTGPRARQRMGEAHVDETILTRGWDMLDTCWHKLDGLRTQYGHIHAQTDEVDLFASGWQLFIFEAHNIIREALKQRMLALGEAPYIHLPSNSSLRTHVKGLHERALRHCNVVLRMVMVIVKSHIDLAQSSPFFAYDVALIRDACFFAPILLATIDSNLYASEDDLRRDIDLCIHATRSMRFAYRRCSDREKSIETLWDLRRHRLHNTRAQGRPPPLVLTAPNFLPPSSTPPALSMPHLFYAPNSTGWETTQHPMTIALHPADQQSVHPGYAGAPITPTVKEGSSEDWSHN